MGYSCILDAPEAALLALRDEKKSRVAETSDEDPRDND